MSKDITTLGKIDIDVAGRHTFGYYEIGSTMFITFITNPKRR